MSAEPTVPPPATIEDTLSRIEVLLQEMESGDLPLDGMITRFEEGANLVKACQERLDAAEKRIKVVIRNTRGEASGVEDFVE